MRSYSSTLVKYIFYLSSFMFFVLVLPRRAVPTVGFAEEDELLPQWAIAVIVIGLASLLFVIIFGVTVVSYHFIKFIYFLTIV